MVGEEGKDEVEERRLNGMTLLPHDINTTNWTFLLLPARRNFEPDTPTIIILHRLSTHSPPHVLSILLHHRNPQSSSIILPPPLLHSFTLLGIRCLMFFGCYLVTNSLAARDKGYSSVCRLGSIVAENRYVWSLSLEGKQEWYCFSQSS